MLTIEEKKSLEEICWAMLYADISYSSMLRRMLHIHGNLKECPQNIKDGYVAVRKAQRIMGEIIQDYGIGSDVSLLNLGPEEMYPSKPYVTQRGKRQAKKNAPSGAGIT